MSSLLLAVASSSFATLTALLYAVQSLATMQVIFVPALALLYYLSGVRWYIASDTHTIRQLSRQFTWGSSVASFNGRTNHCGYVRYKWSAFGYASIREGERDSNSIHLFCTEATWQRLTAFVEDETVVKPALLPPLSSSSELANPGGNDDVGEKEDRDSDNNSDNNLDARTVVVNTVIKPGGHDTCWFRLLTTSINYTTPYDYQRPIVDAIVTHFNQHGHCVALLSGDMDTGKSYMLFLLASYFATLPEPTHAHASLGRPSTGSSNRNKVIIANSVYPWEPSVDLGFLINYLDEDAPTLSKPMIICFDEIDIVLTGIVNGRYRSDRYRTQINDKPSWNLFLDNVRHRIYGRTIILLTSNKTRDEISRELGDDSLLRDGRIDLEFNIVRPITTVETKKTK